MAKPQPMTQDRLVLLLKANDCNLSKVGYDLNVSPQRVHQLCKDLGITIAKSIVTTQKTDTKRGQDK